MSIENLINTELKQANEKHDDSFNSRHEAFAVILEEYEETQELNEVFTSLLDSYWQCVKEDRPDDARAVLAKMYDVVTSAIEKWVQVATMCVKAGV